MSSNVSLAPHLQRALDAMSKDLAIEPQALVNQAVFAWLRINGYVTPGAQLPLPLGGEGRGEGISSPTPVPEPMPVIPDAPFPVPEPVVVPPAPAVQRVDVGPVLLRMAEIDADLEKLAKPWPAWSPVQDEEEEEDEQEEEAESPVDEADESAPEEEEQEEPQPPEDSDDPGIDANTGETDVAAEDDLEEPSESTIVLRSVPISLYLEREGEEPIRVTSERFIIGRGPHCDLVIDSPRVSREHVALTRKGVLYYLEDLNSSNGTWFDGERVTTRELESGDVINLGNEPVTFILRGE